jgi:esterase/lipase
MVKTDFILINGFASNKNLIKGLSSYINEFFNVHIIDLPGHGKNAETIDKISINNIVKYVDGKISNLKLKPNYIIGGISFGFLIASGSKAIKKSKAIIAIEPYLDSTKLRMGEFEGKVMAEIIKIICKTNNYKTIWDSKFLREILKRRGYKQRIVEVILDTIDPKSFFEIAKILLTHNKKIKFYNKPYILIINKEDELLNAEKEIIEFTEKANKLLVIHTKSPHVPEKPTKTHFKKHLSEVQIKRAINFINKNA